MANVTPRTQKAPLPSPRRGLLSWLEHITLLAESPVVRLLGDPRFNPLYHTGTITVLLLLVIFITGVYLTMFYQFGFVASYEAIARLSGHAFNHWMRGVHRYASDAVIITTLLHAWRTFMQDRFRGPRWLAWATGVGMTLFLWLIGVTGYWLLWDERAQVINLTLIRLLDGISWGEAFLVRFLTGAEAGSGWIFLLLVISAHLFLSIILVVFYLWHIKRLSRPKWFPPAHISFPIALLLLLVAALVPVELLPPAHPTRLPAEIPADPLYLLYLPWATGSQANFFWYGIVAVSAIAAALPWLLKRKTQPHARVDLERCDGCVLCSRDCPYNAITMQPRTDGKRPKFQAEVNPALCVGCGICIGSCPENAITLTGVPGTDLWQSVPTQAAQAREVIFVCERHLKHSDIETGDEQSLVPLTCAGMLNPDLIGAALDGGAESVKVIGCPPEDCLNREGNRWLQERIERKRLPRLRTAYLNKPLTTSWVEPTRLRAALRHPAQSAATAYNFQIETIQPRALLPAVLLLIVSLSALVLTNRVPLQPFSETQAFAEISLQHRSGYPVENADVVTQLTPGATAPTRLTVQVDGQTALDQTYTHQGEEHNRQAIAYERVALTPGEHRIQLTLYDGERGEQVQNLFDKRIRLESYQTLKLSFRDEPLESDPEEGRKLYYETSLGTNAGCRICHSLEPGVVLVGPSFAGIATRAATRIPGMSAEEYLRQSILEPDAYVVEGFPAGQMVQNLGEILTEEQINDLVAFLMTLK